MNCNCWISLILLASLLLCIFQSATFRTHVNYPNPFRSIMQHTHLSEKRKQIISLYNATCPQPSSFYNLSSNVYCMISITLCKGLLSEEKKFYVCSFIVVFIDNFSLLCSVLFLVTKFTSVSCCSQFVYWIIYIYNTKQYNHNTWITSSFF